MAIDLPPKLVRCGGIEPPPSDWKSGVQPLTSTPLLKICRLQDLHLVQLPHFANGFTVFIMNNSYVLIIIGFARVHSNQHLKWCGMPESNWPLNLGKVVCSTNILMPQKNGGQLRACTPRLLHLDPISSRS